MPPRSPLTDLAALALLGWAVLIGYTSLPTLLSGDPLWDGGISVLGALLAAAHLAAAVGISRRLAWGRGFGLVMGFIGVFGSAAVLLTLAPAVIGGVPGVPEPPFVTLAIPAGMVAVYLAVVLILLRAKAEFGRTG